MLEVIIYNVQEISKRMVVIWLNLKFKRLNPGSVRLVNKSLRLVDQSSRPGEEKEARGSRVAEEHRSDDGSPSTRRWSQ